MPAPGRIFCRRDGIEGFSFFQEAYSAGFQQGYQWLQEHTKEFIIRRKNEHYRSKDEPDQKLLRLTDAFAEEGAPEESCQKLLRLTDAFAEEGAPEESCIMYRETI